MTHRIFVDGAVGTTGLEINARLADRADLDLLTLDPAMRKDEAARREALNEADIAILCLPDDAARAAVALIDNPRTRVIDASTAHRIAPGWTYGFPEVVGVDAVARAPRVANPGCYATGFIALLAPLVRAGIVPADWPVTCNAVSGYSGGGKAMIAAFEGQGASACQTYGLTLAHKHVPEMRALSGLTRDPLFAPSVVNAYRGMLVEVPLQLAALPTHPHADAARAALAHAYAGAPMVRVHAAPDLGTLDVTAAAGTDRLDIFVFARADGTQARLVAALDNLGKGAAGAAVQNLNIMLGLDPTLGLRV